MAILSFKFMLFLCLSLGVAVQQTVCYRYIIFPSPSSPCPGESNGVSCSTLQQLTSADFRSSQVGDNLILELQSGIHVQENTFSIRSIRSVEVIGHNATIL